MPRPLLHREKQKEELRLSVVPQVKAESRLSLDERNRLLRKKRSAAYVKACQQLDAGGHVTNQERVNAILQQLGAEFPEIELNGLLIGIVAKCYLGDPYEVHSLDITGSIIEHYKKGQAMPGGLEKARSLAIYGSYAFIEVYTDCCRAISEDGTVSVVP